jgi:hypothetical protein
MRIMDVPRSRAFRNDIRPNSHHKTDIASLNRDIFDAHALGMFVADSFKAPAGLKPENFLLRHQLKLVFCGEQCWKSF